MQVPLWPFFLSTKQELFQFLKQAVDWSEPTDEFRFKAIQTQRKTFFGLNSKKEEREKKNHEIFFFSHFQNSFTRLIEIANRMHVRPQPLFPFKTFRQFFFIWRPEFFFVFQKIRLGNKVFFPCSGKPKYLLEFFLGRASLLLVQSRGFRTKS